MDDYIKRKSVIRLITQRYENPEICEREINEIPAADVAPVVHTRWGYDRHGNGECPVCGCDDCGFTNYCPNCGAKMDLTEPDTTECGGTSTDSTTGPSRTRRPTSRWPWREPHTETGPNRRPSTVHTIRTRRWDCSSAQRSPWEK